MSALHRHLHHAGVKVGDEHPVGFVILGLQTQRVGLDAQVDVLADEDGRVFRLRLLDGRGERENPVVHAVAVEMGVAVDVAVFLEDDFQFAAVGQFYPFTQTALTAKAVEHPRHHARVLAQLGRLAFEPVNFLDDLDGN